MTDEIVHFGDREALWTWLLRNHASHSGVWVRLGTSGGRLAGISFHDLLEREGRMTDTGRAALGMAGRDVRGPAGSP